MYPHKRIHELMDRKDLVKNSKHRVVVVTVSSIKRQYTDLASTWTVFFLTLSLTCSVTWSNYVFNISLHFGDFPSWVSEEFTRRSVRPQSVGTPSDSVKWLVSYISICFFTLLMFLLKTSYFQNSVYFLQALWIILFQATGTINNIVKNSKNLYL